MHYSNKSLFLLMAWSE